MRKALILPTKYVQGEDELLNLGYFVSTFGKLALTREYELCVARASKYVDKASPIPATKNLVGALATTFVSTITTLGLCLK